MRPRNKFKSVAALEQLHRKRTYKPKVWHQQQSIAHQSLVQFPKTARRHIAPRRSVERVKFVPNYTRHVRLAAKKAHMLKQKQLGGGAHDHWQEAMARTASQFLRTNHIPHDESGLLPHPTDLQAIQSGLQRFKRLQQDTPFTPRGEFAGFPLRRPLKRSASTGRSLGKNAISLIPLGKRTFRVFQGKRRKGARFSNQVTSIIHELEQVSREKKRQMAN